MSSKNKYIVIHTPGYVYWHIGFTISDTAFVSWLNVSNIPDKHIGCLVTMELLGFVQWKINTNIKAVIRSAMFFFACLSVGGV